MSIERLPSKRKSNSLKKLLPCWNSNAGITILQWLMATKIELMQCSLIIFQRTFKNFITKLINKICQAKLPGFYIYLAHKTESFTRLQFLVNETTTYQYLIRKIHIFLILEFSSNVFKNSLNSIRYVNYF